MHTHPALALAAALLLAIAGGARAQTPATNLMPDGSHDLYLGLGVVSQPRYDGAAGQRTRALPLVQVEFSNGIFLSGMSAGMHLSASPGVEYGPLLGWQARRDDSGTGAGLGGISEGNFQSLGPVSAATARATAPGANRLAGMDHVGGHVQAGGFFNYYLSPQVRLISSALAGAGGNGVVVNLGVQHFSGDFSAQHRLAVSAGVELVNRAYNTTFFGVSAAEHLRTGNAEYAPGGGVKDVYVAARWNWALSPAWMLSSSARLSRLQGDARSSPLVERPSQYSISTGLARRF